MSLADVLSQATVNAIAATGQLVIHCVGDTGGIERAEPQLAVADAMTADFQGKTGASGQPAFFYHLGDVVYFFGQESYYPEQFYEPYRNYPGPIFAIPGNHDGFMFKGEPAGSSCEAFVDNFCTAAPTQGAPGFDRTTLTQPGVYFTLDAPFVRIIGLYSNAGETVGSLGNSTIGRGQLTFLTSELKRYASDRQADKSNQNPQALVIAVHHPPFTGSSQHMPSAAMLQAMDTCCTQAGQWPDMVLSGHAHLYERYTRIMKSGGRQIPYVVAGNGGYYDLSGLKKNKQGQKPVAGQQKESDGAGNTITLDSYSDNQFGFLRITFNASSIAVESIAVNTAARTDTTSRPRRAVSIPSRSISRITRSRPEFLRRSQRKGRPRFRLRVPRPSQPEVLRRSRKRVLLLVELRVQLLEPGRQLVSVRKSRQLSVLVKRTEESNRHRRSRPADVVVVAVVDRRRRRRVDSAQSVRDNDRWIARQICRNQLLVGRRCHDDVDFLKQLGKLAHTEGSRAVGLDVLNRRIKPRDTEVVRPVLRALFREQLVAAAHRQVVKRRRGLCRQQRNHRVPRQLRHSTGISVTPILVSASNAACSYFLS